MDKATGKNAPTLLAAFVKNRRRQYGLTQAALAERAGVGLRFIRDLEQGKPTLRLDKVNQVLILFGHTAGAVPLSRETLIHD